MNQEELRHMLIELLEQCSCPYSPPCTSECYECNKVEMYDKEIENIADHLIANGVTIRERGEWIGSSWDYKGNHMKKCTNCQNFSTEYSDDFCPHCGADMRGVKDE